MGLMNAYGYGRKMEEERWVWVLIRHSAERGRNIGWSERGRRRLVAIEIFFSQTLPFWFQYAGPSVVRRWPLKRASIWEGLRIYIYILYVWPHKHAGSQVGNLGRIIDTLCCSCGSNRRDLHVTKTHLAVVSTSAWWALLNSISFHLIKMTILISRLSRLQLIC